MRPPEAAVSGAAVALGRALRREGVRVGVPDELLFCRALAEIELDRREHVYWAARASFLRRPDDGAAFDAVFDRFWAGLSLEAAGTPIAEHGESDPRMPGPQHGGESLPQFRQEGRSGHLLDGNAVRASFNVQEFQTSGGDEVVHDRRRGILAAYSPNELETEPDRLDFDAGELAAVRRLADELRAAAPERQCRRLRPSGRAGQLDVRRTLRDSLSTDGEALRLAYSGSSRKPRRLLIICDVSGSMERYSRALLGALQGAVGAGIRAEAFVFATRLTRLTNVLSGHDVERALGEARDAVSDWSGGTRIGEALGAFNRTYARLGLARGSIVLVVSDGWDRGDPDFLAREVARLRLQCRRLIWLNPRPANVDGQPLAVGMRAALPYVDDFVPGCDPRGLELLVRLVRGLGPGRPERRQRPPLSASRWTT